jgi:hypothetical protein
MSICIDAYKPIAVIKVDGKPFAYPESVFVERDGSTQEVSPFDVKVGDRVTGYTEERKPLLPESVESGESFEIEIKSGFIE